MATAKTIFDKIVGAHWQSTLSGLVVAVLVLIEPLIESGSFDWQRDKYKVYGAIVSAVIGRLINPKPVEKNDTNVTIPPK